MATYDKSLTKQHSRTKTPEQAHITAMQVISYLGVIATIIAFIMELIFAGTVLYANNITIFQCMQYHLQTSASYLGLVLFTFLGMLFSMGIFEKYSYKARLLDEQK